MKIKELRIQQLPLVNHGKIQTISFNSGKTISEFMRPKIREIVESFPEHLKTKTVKENKEMRITGIPEDMVESLKNISENLGISQNQLICLKIHEIIESTPESFKLRY